MAEIVSTKMQTASQTQWLTPAIPALGRLRQEDYHEFEAGLSYIKVCMCVKCLCLFVWMTLSSFIYT